MSRTGMYLNAILGELAGVCGRIDMDGVDALAKAVSDAPAVFVAGAGRSGLALRSFAMRLMHLGKNVHVVGEVVTPAIVKGDLLLVGSGSGETGSLGGMARKAKEAGCGVALVTINPESSIGRLADVAVRIPAPSPKAAHCGDFVKSAQPMGSLFEQALLLVLDAVIMELMAELGKVSEEMFRLHANLE